MRQARWLCVAVCCGMAGFFATHGEEPPAPPKPEEEKVVRPFNIPVPPRRDVIKFIAGTPALKATALEKVKAAFLGVTTRQADVVLRKQLKLPQGVGLVVTYLDKDGPAKAAGLELHDVLHKFNDQILVNPQQLLTLVRMHKPGEKVALTLFREGQERKVEVALVEKEVLPLAAFDETGMLPPGPGASRVLFEAESLQDATAQGFGFPQRMAFADSDVKITVVTRDGKPYVTAKDKDGKVLYEGEYSEGAKVPEQVQARLGEALLWTMQAGESQEAPIEIERLLKKVMQYQSDETGAFQAEQ